MRLEELNENELKKLSKKELKKLLDQDTRYLRDKKVKQILYDNKEWYTSRAVFGNWWANWFVFIGARERGKTYTVQDYVLGEWFNKDSPMYHVPFYLMRLNDVAIKNMIMNNGAKLFESLLVPKYHLEKIKVKGDTVYYEGNILCYVFSLSTAYNYKGASLFSAKDFKGARIIIDEVALEKGQRKTFDVVYNLKMQIENIVRHERENVKVFMLLNNTEDCPELVAMFGFVPIEFGTYKLKRKHCVIDYIPNNKAYDERRKKALANEIDSGTGNFTNKVARDLSLLNKKRLHKPSYIIKFYKEQDHWYTVWDDKIICPYKGEKVRTIAMRRGLDDYFIPSSRDDVIALYDVRAYTYKDILTKSLIDKEITQLKGSR